MNNATATAPTAARFFKVTYRTPNYRTQVEAGLTCPISAAHRVQVLKDRGMKQVELTEYTENRT